MRTVELALLAGFALGAVGCPSNSDDCAEGTSATRTFEARGQATVRRFYSLACSEHGGANSFCAPGDLEVEPCCTFRLASDPVEDCEQRQTCCVARALPAPRQADGALPTFVELDCPFWQVSFLLPDLRHREVGTFSLPLTVVAWDTPAPEDLPSAARARVSGGDVGVGGELTLAVEVLEKTGGPRDSGDRLATDDFAVRVRANGALPDASLEGDVPRIAFELELTQTDADYPDAGCD